MTTVGIYVDGPNMERGLFEAGELTILERVGSLLMEHAHSFGEVMDAECSWTRPPCGGRRRPGRTMR